MITAIRTKYNGYEFRSRLEARWAVFFDALGIRYEYEPEGFGMDGDWYLPDFWLPTFGAKYLVEVKPLGDDFTKARKFAPHLPHSLLLLAGPPNTITYEYYDECYGAESSWVDCMFDDYVVEENRLFSCTGNGPGWNYADSYGVCDLIENAIKKSRQVKFNGDDRLIT